MTALLDATSTSDPTPAADAAPDPLLPFMAETGRTLCAAGVAVHEVQADLYAIARAYHADRPRVVVLPSVVFLQLVDAGRLRTEIAPVSKRGLRFDQLYEVIQLTRSAKRGAITPVDGLARLHAIWESQPRLGRLKYLIGHVLMVVGLGLILQPTPMTIAFCVVLGALVGLIKWFGGSYANLQVLVPIIASTVVSTIVLLLTADPTQENILRILIFPLVTFLPGAALTVGTEELVNGEIVSGSTRLIAGFIQLLLLSFGMIAAVTLVGLQPQEVLRDAPANTIGWWAPWLGVAVFGLGVTLHLSGPLRFLPALLVALYCTWLGQAIGTLLLGPDLGQFVSGFVLVMTVHALEYLGGPPTTLTFLPGFWLLVPGATGLIGITQIFAGNQVYGYEDFVSTFLIILSIVIGMLVALALVSTLRVASRRVRTF